MGLGITITWLSGDLVHWNLTPTTTLIGLAMSIPPLIVNAYLWSYGKSHTDSIYYRFSAEVITPLCMSMNLFTIFIVAIASGLCEEFFFRGVLNNLFVKYVPSIASCIATSFIFASVHFIGSFKRYWAMLPLYFAMGCYLWIVYRASNSLGCVALTHGIYNFVVIIITKHIATR